MQVFIPELGATFRAAPGFRVFGAQNPVAEGGGRRGLPRSFLNRFTRVAVELLGAEDLLHISGAACAPLSVVTSHFPGFRQAPFIFVMAFPIDVILHMRVIS